MIRRRALTLLSLTLLLRAACGVVIKPMTNPEAQIRNEFLQWSGANFNVLQGVQLQPNSKPQQYGTFQNGQDIVDVQPQSGMVCSQITTGTAYQGVVISTGNVIDIANGQLITRNEDFEGSCLMGAGQPGCDRKRAVAPGSRFDHAGFTVKFRSLGAGNFEFNYVFASTELPRYGGQDFNDEFELKINTVNIAKLCGCGMPNAASCSADPDPNKVVKINNLTPVSGLDPSLPGEPTGKIIQFPAGSQPGRPAPVLASQTNQWSPLFRANIQGVFGGVSVKGTNGRGASGDAGSSKQDTVTVPSFWPKLNGPFVFSGFTYLLAARHAVRENIDYTLNVSIYDVTDGYFDSALFLTGKAQVSLPVSYQCQRGPTGPCSVSCGQTGFTTTTATCLRNDGRQVNSQLCPGNCVTTTQQCFQQQCPTVAPLDVVSMSGNCGQWGPCSATCQGTQSRTCTCTRFTNGIAVQIPRAQWSQSAQCSTLALQPLTQACGAACPLPCSCTLGEWSRCPVTCGTGNIFRQVTCSAGGQYIPPERWQASNCNVNTYLGQNMTSTCNQTPCLRMCPCIEYKVTCQDTGACLTCRQPGQTTCGSKTRSCGCRKYVSGQDQNGVPVDCCFCAGLAGDKCGVTTTPCPTCAPCERYRCEFGPWGQCPTQCYRQGDPQPRQLTMSRVATCKSCINGNTVANSFCPGNFGVTTTGGGQVLNALSQGCAASQAPRGSCPNQTQACPMRPICDDLRCRAEPFVQTKPSATCSRGCPGEEGYSYQNSFCEQCLLHTNPPTCTIVSPAMCINAGMDCRNQTRPNPPLPPCIVASCQVSSAWSACTAPQGSLLTVNGAQCSCDGRSGVSTRSVQCVAQQTRCTANQFANSQGLQCGQPCTPTGTPIPVPDSFCQTQGVASVGGGQVAQGIRNNFSAYCGSTQQNCAIPPCPPVYKCECKTLPCTANCQNCNTPGYVATTCTCQQCQRTCGGVGTNCQNVPSAQCQAAGVQCLSSQQPCSVPCPFIECSPFSPCSKTCTCDGQAGIMTRSAQCKTRTCGAQQQQTTNVDMQTCLAAGLQVNTPGQGLRVSKPQERCPSQPCQVAPCATPRTCVCGQPGPCQRNSPSATCGAGTMITPCTCNEAVLGPNCAVTGQTKQVAKNLCANGCADRSTPCGDCCPQCVVGPWSQCPTGCARVDPTTCGAPAAALQQRVVQCRRATDFPTCNMQTAQQVADNTPGCGGAQGLRVSNVGCAQERSKNCAPQIPCKTTKCECTTTPCQGRSCGGQGCGTITTTCKCYRYTQTVTGGTCGTRQEVGMNECSNLQGGCQAQSTRPCDLPPCPPITECYYSPWTPCPGTCYSCGQNQPVQTRTRECRAYQTQCDGVTRSSSQFTVTALNQCPAAPGAGQGLRVNIPQYCTQPLTQPCNLQPCPQYQCQRGTWTTCPTRCGCRGSRTMTAQIMRRTSCDNAALVQISTVECQGNAACAAISAGCTPQTQVCQQTEPCCTHNCINSPFSQCSSTCGSGTRTSVASCQSSCQNCAADGVTQLPLQLSNADMSKCGGGGQGLRVNVPSTCNTKTEPCTMCPNNVAQCPQTPAPAPRIGTPTPIFGTPAPVPAVQQCNAFQSGSASTAAILSQLGWGTTTQTTNWNVQASCSNSLMGTFCGSTCGVGKGAIISTGPLTQISSKKAAEQGEMGNNGPQDDSCTLTFRFNSNAGSNRQLRFRYVFGSREYPEIFNSANAISTQGYGDKVTININGVDVTKMPNGAAFTPQNFKDGRNNYFVQNDPAKANCPAGLTGLSTVFTAAGTATPGSNTITITIADTGPDGTHDSVLMIENALSLSNSRRAGSAKMQPAAAPTAQHMELSDQKNDMVTTLVATVGGVMAVLALMATTYMVGTKAIARRADVKAQMAAEERQ